MSLEKSPANDVSYHLVSFNENGVEREHDGVRASTGVFGTSPDDVTDVFVFSHGWNGDVTDARRQYGRWIDTMADCSFDRPNPFRPLLVGLHWPSKAWGNEDLGDGSFSVDADDSDDPTTRLLGEYGERLGGGAEVTESLRCIVTSARRDAVPATLPADVRSAYANLAKHVEVIFGVDDEELLRIPFDPEDAYQAAIMADLADPVSYTGITLGGVLAPLRVLTFWAMKRRAMLFGQSGAADLLTGLRKQFKDARVHFAGHSFGCIVASAAVAGPPDSGFGSARVNSLVLIQGAMSLWSYCSKIPAAPSRSGYFRAIIDKELVDGPIVTTTSVHDRAVRVFYPLAAGVRGQIDFAPENLPKFGGTGIFGLRGEGFECVDSTLSDVALPLQPNRVYNLNADAVIRKNAGAMGAHSDICRPEVARIVWEAALGERNDVGA